jgi:O-methyltransferase
MISARARSAVLKKLKSLLYHQLLAPPVARLGCRPPFGIPLGRLALGGAFGFDEEERIKEAVPRVRAYTMTTFERLASLWEQVRYLDRCGIAGDLVECGVWKGGSVGLMALAHLARGRPPVRTLHLFDSFEGLPEPRAEVDGLEAVAYAGRRGGGKLESIDLCVGTLADNRRLLEKEIGYPSSLLRYHAGWFEDTLPRDAPGLGAIALLRLDGDWYESTRITLAHLYSKVVPGGVVVIDDYGQWEGCRRAVDEYLSTLAEPVLLNHIDHSARYWVRTSCAVPEASA